MTANDQCIEQLDARVREMFTTESDVVPFHSWSHTQFVRSKAVQFAQQRRAQVWLVEAAALVHDLNYLVESNSTPLSGTTIRAEVLRECGFARSDIQRIERIIACAHTAWRGRQVDVETACLSDADTLYKALPITPVLFSHRYLSENGISLSELARKIVVEQAHKLEDDYYFYDPELTERYGRWAAANLQLWQAVLESIEDPDVAHLVEEDGFHRDGSAQQHASDSMTVAFRR